MDYAMLVSIALVAMAKGYSPAECNGAVKHRIESNLDPK